MKAKLLLFLLYIMLPQFSMGIWGMELKVSKQIELKGKKTNDSHRSIPILPTASVDGSLLSIDFLSIVDFATITIRNAETNEIVYSSTYSSVKKIMIDLEGENKGKYALELCYDETIVLGEFVFEY